MQFFNNLNSINYFKNESMMLAKFLEDEKRLNRRLLELHKSTSAMNSFENECVKKFGGKRVKEYVTNKVLDPHVKIDIISYIFIRFYILFDFI